MTARNREKILNAALRIIERDGITAVTFDAVAAEAAITRSGIVYHYRCRDDLILAIHRHVAERWRQRMLSMTTDPSILSERNAAYIEASGEISTRAEMLLMLESLQDDHLARLWREVRTEWASPVPEPNDQVALHRFLACLAADGLRVRQAAQDPALPDITKSQVIGAIMTMANAGR